MAEKCASLLATEKPHPPGKKIARTFFACVVQNIPPSKGEFLVGGFFL
jgi:hypothetical protein